MTTSALPPPPVPAEADIRDFGFLPLDAVRLRDSNLALLASGDGFRAAVLLWCVAWHQSPAASLPDDDRLLASYVGYGRDLEGWQRIRAEALRGFVLCSDGRLYHPLLAEKACEGWASKLARKARTAAATAARQARQGAEVPQDAAPGDGREAARGDVGRDDQRNGSRDVDRGDPRSVHQGTGKGQGQGQGQGYTPPKPPSGSALPERPTRRKAKPAGELCPEDFTASPSHYDKAAEWGRPRAWVDDQAERMRAWSRANANRDTAWKSNWSQALHNWLRDHRDDGRSLVVAGSRGQGPPGGAVAPARSTSGPSSAQAGVDRAFALDRGEFR